MKRVMQTLRILLCLALAILSLPTLAAITFYGGTVKTGSGPDTLNLRPSASGASGDLLLAQIIAKSDATITPPAGWTKIAAASTTANGLQQNIYYNSTWDGDTSGTEAFVITGTGGSNSSNGVIINVRGASLTTPICSSIVQSAANSTAMTAPSVGVSCANGSGRLAFFGSNNGSYDATLTRENSATAGPTNRAGTGATGVGMFSSYYTMGAAGNGGSQTGTLTSATDSIASTVIIYTPAGVPVVDHIQLEISGTPLTCTPSTVTVKACTNAACTTLLSSSTTVTLSASSGTLGSTSLTFTGSTTTTLSKTTVGNTTLGATSSPAATNSTSCQLNGATAASCLYTFADSGLLLTIPTQRAGMTSNVAPDANTFSVTAVKAGTTAASACVPAFANVTRAVKFWWNYATPSTGTKTLTVNGNSTVVQSATTTAVSTSATGTSLNLTFDSTGTASGSAMTLNYADAGQLTLNARYDGSAGNSDTNLVMLGSNTFVTVPYALCVDSTDSNWNCTAADTTCAKFTSAGTAFNLRVTGKSYQAATATCSLPTTPNYIQSNLDLTSTLVAPSGGVNATLSQTRIDITSGGTATLATQTVSEVGVFTITATPTAGAYFSATAPAGSSNSGRFIPAGFAISTPTFVARSDFTCSSVPSNPANSAFSYLGETVTSAFTLKAVNAGGTTTANYTGSFSRLSLTPGTSTAANWTGLAIGAQSGGTLLNPSATASANRMTVVCNSGCVTSGVAAKLVSGTGNLQFTLTPLRPYNTNTPDGPYAAIFTMAARDVDGVGMLTPAYDWDLTGGNDAVNIGAVTSNLPVTTTLYFGRMRIDNAYGSSLLNLPVQAYAQYWNGTAFVKSTNDSCTQIKVPATTTVPATPAATLYCTGGVGLYGSLTGVAATANGITAGNMATLSSGVLGGTSGLILSKPTNSGGGYLDLALYVPDYLKYNIDGVDQTLTPAPGPTCTAVPDSYLHDDNPRARMRFGARANDRVIYLREVY